MTAEELEAILRCAEFQQGLERMSARLADRKQEGPIIHLLAKFLRRPGRVIQFEDKRRDLVVDQTHLEFKYHFDFDMAKLEGELKNRDHEHRPLSEMWGHYHKSKSWRVVALIYDDMCHKKGHKPLPDIFVWIICERDLRNLPPDARNRICMAMSEFQRNWSETHRYSDPANVRAADSLLAKVSDEERPCMVRKVKVDTNGDFRSIYHFRICDFSNTEAFPGAEQEVQPVNPGPSAIPARQRTDGKIRVKGSSLRVGDKVRYVGWRLTYNFGKVAEIMGIRDENGFWLKYENGTVGSATPGALELVK